MPPAVTAAIGFGQLAETMAEKKMMAEVGKETSDTLAWMQMDVNANKKGNEIAGNAI